MFECGDHICALYSSEQELAKLAANFLAEGLRRGERCWYVEAAAEGEAIAAALRKRGVNVEGASRRGALNIIGDRNAYVVDGTFDPERTMDVFNDAIEQALT